MQNPVTLLPDKIKVIYIVLIAVIEAYLTAVSIIFQLPVWRRCDDEMDILVFQFLHPSTIADDYSSFGIFRFH
ncbi:MAG: hypothetical protein AB1638_07730 [Nitrospirota bacterium]